MAEMNNAISLSSTQLRETLSLLELESLLRSLHSMLLASSAQSEIEIHEQSLEVTEQLTNALVGFGLKKAEGQDRWVPTNANATVQNSIGFLRDWWINTTLPLWRSICKSSFSVDHNNSTFADASVIIDLYQSLHRSAHIDGRNITVHYNNSDNITKSLIELGFYRMQKNNNSNWGFVFLGWGFTSSAPEIRNTSSSREYTDAANTSMLTALEKEKNAVRNEVHAETASKQKNELETLIQQMKSFGMVLETKAQQMPVTSKQLEKSIELETERFAKTYGKTVGAHPFIGGLKLLLKNQIGSQWVWQWQLDDAVFSHSGPPGFMEDAIKLFETIGLRPYEEPAQLPDSAIIRVEARQASEEPGLRTWVFDANVTDRMLQAARHKIASVKKIQTNNTGKVVQSSIPRTHVSEKLSSGGCCLPFF
eukprot:TRINITY_DN9699_c0_g1_i2.p1 TRINITY_DN9699_c0_g1~~TRINITY_DN9699_c0_g1_i2.p1  ORF type:complete len:422 (+),score=89.93 TRINITY_DN9699_c0_g1_i2:97-1362(+)